MIQLQNNLWNFYEKKIPLFSPESWNYSEIWELVGSFYYMFCAGVIYLKVWPSRHFARVTRDPRWARILMTRRLLHEFPHPHHSHPSCFPWCSQSWGFRRPCWVSFGSLINWVHGERGKKYWKKLKILIFLEISKYWRLVCTDAFFLAYLKSYEMCAKFVKLMYFNTKIKWKIWKIFKILGVFTLIF